MTYPDGRIDTPTEAETLEDLRAFDLAGFLELDPSELVAVRPAGLIFPPEPPTLPRLEESTP